MRGKLRRNRYLVLVAVLSVLGVFLGGLLAPIEMVFVTSIVESESLAGLIYTVGAIASLVGVLMFNRMATRGVGGKRLLSGALLFSVALPLLYANSFNLLTLYGVRFAWAFVGAGMAPILDTLLQTELKRREKIVGRSFGLIYAVQAGAGMVAAFASGVMADVWGFGVVFWVMTVVVIAQYVVVRLVIRERGEINEVKQVGMRGGLRFLLESRELEMRTILGAGFNAAWHTKAILYPLIILSVTEMYTVVGAVMATQGLVAMIALVPVGKLVDRKGYLKVLVAGHTMLVIGLVVFGVSGAIWGLFAAAVIVALGEACNGPATAALDVRVIPDKLRNSVNSFQSLCGIVLGIVSTAVVALALARFDARAVIVCLAGFVVVTMVVGLGIAKGEVGRISRSR